MAGAGGLRNVSGDNGGVGAHALEFGKRETHLDLGGRHGFNALGDSADIDVFQKKKRDLRGRLQISIAMIRSIARIGVHYDTIVTRGRLG